MIQFFDAHIRPEGVDDWILENFAYFNIRTVLLASHAPQSFERSEDLLNYFGDLVTNEFLRFERAGLRPLIALGVHPRAVPRRAHYELWRELPLQLADPVVAAMGELALERVDPSEEALLARQLAMARELDVPVLVTTSRRERARKVRRVLEIVRSVGISTECVFINHVDSTCIRPVVDAGCWAGVTVGPHHLTSDEATRLLRRYCGIGLGRTVLNSGLRGGAADIFALPKMALCLAQSGFSASEIRRLVCGNAMQLFGQGRRSTS